MSLQYNGDNSYFFVNGSQELKFKLFVNYLDRNLLCVGNISSDWSLTNGTKTGLYGNFYDFAVDYVPLNSEKTIHDIHGYLIRNIRYKMFSLLKKIILLIFSPPIISGYCLFLKHQECTVRKVIIDNDYMTFYYKIGVDGCIGSCNSKNNPYYKICLPNSIKKISVKSLDLISQSLVFKNISFQKTCKCGCLLDDRSL